MSPSTRLAGTAAAAVLVLSAAGPQVSTAAGPPPPPRADGVARSVTLITGDRVLLDGDRVRSVVAGPGRDRVVFRSFRRDGHLNVVPGDAARALSQGRLDPRLFDVTGLVEAGYDDARRDTVPLVVAGDRADEEVAAAGLRTTRDLPAVGAYAAQVAKDRAADAWRTLVSRASVRKVWLDGVRRPSLDRSTAQIGAPAAWSAGYTGTGIKVAVLDSGVDGEHPDLAGREAAQANFTDEPDNTDAVGHGTHVAATIASVDAKYRGVAPDARLLDGKVCTVAGCQESWVLAGMQWAADQGADVVNLSLGGTDTPETDPLEEAVATLSASSGTLFVIAAGNSSRPGTINSPGSADAALTVGAVDRQEGIAPFSSRGPRVGDGAVKPDITAPGVAIAAAKASKGFLGDPVDDRHVSMSGTSMATPHVAGAAALLAQQHPDWTGARIKAALVASARNNPALTAFDQGAGRVDLAKAITQTVTSEPASLAMGLQKWPHTDDVPVTRTVVYRNTGSAAVALTVTTDVKGPDGAAAPSGLITASPAKVTVPAGGQASVTVTADTRRGSLDGLYVGSVVATGGPTALRTAISVNREVESYDVAFSFVDANGAPASDYYASVIGLDNDVFAFPYDEDGAFTMRLPKGDYFANADVTTGDQKLALLPRPALSVTADTTVTVDARTARPLRITAPDPAAQEALGDITIVRRHGDRLASFSTAFLGGFGQDISIAHSGPELATEEMTVLLGAQLRGTPMGEAPLTYRLSWTQHGRLPTGFERSVTRADLAEVRTRFGAAPADGKRGLGGNPITPDGIGGWAWMPDVAAPGEAVDLVTVDGLSWSWGFLQFTPSGAVEASLTSPERTYGRGTSSAQRFNDPVFSPALPRSRSPQVARSGDRISVAVPLFADGAGNGGSTNATSARTALWRDGVLVGETANGGNGLFDVPGGAADFRLETSAVRAPGISEFSAEVRSSWTFRSDTVPQGEFRPLPLSVVRFAPVLDERGAAPVGPLEVPLVVQQLAGAGQLGRIDVEASFDDGRTWRAVPVSDGVARVDNPAAGFASLRVKAVDSAGNALEHTVVRAYRIG
ncbi:S8 family serine peptidase [Saccharothrix coeruleofusca]|uniref:Serine protease n=1 Tax=Saccharothrix coeruleofusca TaxID=33919 RepID=A0A918ARE1_9PSEU|nr:S8 family serine peptidase [Saccharothrix coeruleofusca]GGP73264.1 serine protease [Saccharothrix coeruleofusca]